MNKRIADIHSLLLPVQEGQLLLPNAAVAEIVEYNAPIPMDDAPAWCLGTVAWRGIEIPLLSYEAFVGGELPAEQSRLRIAVLNTLNGNVELPFIGVVLQGIPRLLTAGNDTVVVSADGDSVDGIASKVLAGSEPAMVPDLDALERSISSLNAA